MSIIDHVLKEELSRLQKLSIKYRNDLRSLPKGSISIKIRNGNSYAYRAYRFNDKVKFEYLGKLSSPVVKEMQKQIDKRLQYLNKLRQVNNDIKKIKKAVRGLSR